MPKGEQLAAQALLAERAWVVLDPEQARRFGSERLTADPTLLPVLLRGLETREGWPGVADDRNRRLAERDRLRVFWKHGIVHVLHDSHRHFPPPPQRRRAILALLPAEPREVFTSAEAVIVGSVTMREE